MLSKQEYLDRLQEEKADLKGRLEEILSRLDDVTKEINYLEKRQTDPTLTDLPAVVILIIIPIIKKRCVQIKKKTRNKFR